MITIKEWMDNKTILMTGGAGFLGKVLTEKLLRTCSGVKRIYLIIRPKRGKTPQERWDDIIKDELFAKLLADSPDIISRKVTVLCGDMSQINLGLSKETIEELENNVNIVFHSAATIRFNDPLHNSFLTNTRGTLELCKLAERMSNLEIFVHISTAFCHHNMKKNYFEEKIYEPCQDWKTMLKIIDQENPIVVNTISYKIIGDHPNTYTFSKSLSEKVVEEYSYKFPVVILRPPVVMGMIKEPLPGWTDNLNAIVGITTGVCKGVIRVLKAKKQCAIHCVPVDVAINAIIISGWDKATSENKELSIYNCAYEDYMRIDFGELNEEGIVYNEKYCTLDPGFWYPLAVFTENNFIFYILNILLHFLPAIFMDLILCLMKSKTRLLKITIKIYLALQAVSAFTLREVRFDNTKYKSLWGKLTEDEAEVFSLRPLYELTSKAIWIIFQKGVKKYFLKEKMEDEEYHRLKLKRLYYLDRFVRGIIIITSVVILLYKLI